MEGSPRRSVPEASTPGARNLPLSQTARLRETGCELASPASSPRNPRRVTLLGVQGATEPENDGGGAATKTPVSVHPTAALAAGLFLAANPARTHNSLRGSITAAAVTSPRERPSCSEASPPTRDGSRRSAFSVSTDFPRAPISRGHSQDEAEYVFDDRGISSCGSTQLDADDAHCPFQALGGRGAAAARVSCGASTSTGEDCRLYDSGEALGFSPVSASRYVSAQVVVRRRPGGTQRGPGDGADSAASAQLGDRDAAGVPPYMHIDAFPQVTDTENFDHDDLPGAEVVLGSHHPSTPFGLMKEILVAIYMVYAFLTGCVYFGWPSLACMLYKSGAYSWVCEKDENGNYVDDLRGTTEADEPNGEPKYYICDNQDVAVSPLFTICYVTQTLMSVVAGTLLDHVSPKKTAMLGQTLTGIGWLLLACSSERFPAYVASMVFIGLGADTGYLPTLLIATLFPGKRATVITLLGTANTSSFAVPLLLAMLWNNVLSSWTFSQICILYLCAGPVFCFILAALFIPWRAYGKPLPGSEAPQRELEKDCKGNKLSGRNADVHWTDKARGREDAGKRDSLCEGVAPGATRGSFLSRSKTGRRTGNWPGPTSFLQRLLRSLQRLVGLRKSERNGVRAGPDEDGKREHREGGEASLGIRSDHAVGTTREDEGYPGGRRLGETGEDLEGGTGCHFMTCEECADAPLELAPVTEPEKRASTRWRACWANRGSRSGEKDPERLPESGEKLVRDGRSSVGPCCHRGNQVHRADDAPAVVALQVEERSCGVAGEPSFVSQLCSSHFVCIALYWSCQAVATSFFQTAASRLFTTRVVDFMDFALSFSFIPCVLLGKTVDIFGPFPVLILINTAGALVYFLSIVGQSFFPTGANGVHYMAVICFCVYVSIDSEQVFCYVENTFSSRHFGKLSGLALTVGGIISLGSIPLYENVTIRLLKGDALPVAWSIAVVLSVVYVMLGCMWRVRRRNPRAFHSHDDAVPVSRDSEARKQASRVGDQLSLTQTGKTKVEQSDEAERSVEDEGVAEMQKKREMGNQVRSTFGAPRAGFPALPS
ncbi:major facilitator superfamily domain-containing protein [Neospora caninum Liverpool]|uniref:Major facilitator superfamily domain-containing protein n=1 Tax=Neospora caninum (strain Liverpool) TaxID=572307 RepID=F0VG35_NEOCL|nr:major facilitator superfamily domain-containing protein [Neospora caninum Liverpool]CBZ52679.1 major facilitator superfamily domain-containing protein [Neospora caninum Liverpool]CEL66656.1 TPA: major facilitator superfamily domain-containing protein, putative [Neospora caninum Liverpool]|eukprot:XP_003882711.1 major facilitator superfamily domain-containing protein [Neospora caninum Liverpool]